MSQIVNGVCQMCSHATDDCTCTVAEAEAFTARMQVNSDGTLPHSSWPGLYPLFYIMGDCGVLCADCANGKNGSCAVREGTDDGMSDKSWTIVGQDINYEDADMYCDHCGVRIPSAYAEPE